MAKPVSGPLEWATDATQTTGPESGQPPRLAPSSGYQTQGWIATEEAPARYMNYALGVLGDWTEYVDGLHTDTDFIDQDFVWGGEHTFDGDGTVNGLWTFSTAPVFPAGFSAAGFVATPGHIGLGGPTNEIIYTDSIGVPAPRPRIEMISLASGVLSANVTGVVTATLVSSSAPSYWYWPSTSGQITFPVNIPRGSVVTNMRVGTSNQSGGSASITCTLFGKAANKTTPSSTSAAAVDTETFNLASLADHVFTLVPSVTVTIDNSVAEYYLVVSGQVDCRIHWVEVTYTDPGPRNG